MRTSSPLAHRYRLVFFCALLSLSRCSCKNDEQAVDLGAPDLALPDLADAPDLLARRDLLPPCATIVCGTPTVCCADGEECVAETCTATCDSGVRCGDGVGVCCDDGQVCLSAACITPGMDCSDSFDCPEGQFCEPTLGKCLPQPMGPLCEYKPTFSTFDTTIEWEWTGHQDASGDPANYSNVCVTPVVGDLDRDGTPDVVFGAYPDTKAIKSGSVWTNADEGKVRLVVLDGKTGVEKLVLPLATLQLEEFSALAIGNLDADPELEIVGIATSGTDKNGTAVKGVFVADLVSAVGGALTAEVRCSQAAGSLAVLGRSGAPLLANLDDEPLPEIVVGGVILKPDCSVVFDPNVADNTLPKLTGCNLGSEATPTNFVRCIPAVANVDGVGRAEIFGGNIAYTYDAANTTWKVLWQDRDSGNPNASTKRDGFVAIAEILPDSLSMGPELVVVSNNAVTGSGEVYLRNAKTGAVVWGPKAIAGNGGPPTVADFDGDGHPEFASATLEAYIVFDTDCDPAGPTPQTKFCPSGATDGVLWKKTTQDKSSSVTGSSVFDFQGDGAAEVVYNDECFLRVYDGKTGNVLFEQQSSSRTATEYPIVVDVDGDNRSEFVVPSNNDMIGRDKCPYCPPDDPATTTVDESLACGRGGLRAFGDPKKQWVRTRRVWNQHTYHVTNVDGDGTIPAVETANWSSASLNNYRQNTQGAGIFNAPNLAVSLAADLTACPTIRLKARVTNAGSLGVAAGVPVSFFLVTGTGAGATKMLLGVDKTTVSLLPGQSETLIYEYDPASGDGGPFDFAVTVDLDATGMSTVTECIEDDNDATLVEIACMSIG